jgi:hypothetical protein
LPIAAKPRPRPFSFFQAPLFRVHAGDGDNEKKTERDMAKMLSITAATALILAAAFPAIYTFISFA